MIFAAARIVVADDRPANVMLLEELLERWGYRNVIGTADSREVVALCEAARPDLLLLDLRMPDPDGFAILEALAGTLTGPARLPVIVLTADDGRETRRRALSLGAQDFIAKPFDP